MVLYGLLAGGRETAIGNETARSQWRGRAVSSTEGWASTVAVRYENVTGIMGQPAVRSTLPWTARPVTAALYEPGRA